MVYEVAATFRAFPGFSAKSLSCVAAMKQTTPNTVIASVGTIYGTIHAVKFQSGDLSSLFASSSVQYVAPPRAEGTVLNSFRASSDSSEPVDKIVFCSRDQKMFVLSGGRVFIHQVVDAAFTLEYQGEVDTEGAEAKDMAVITRPDGHLLAVVTPAHVKFFAHGTTEALIGQAALQAPADICEWVGPLLCAYCQNSGFYSFFVPYETKVVGVLPAGAESVGKDRILLACALCDSLTINDETQVVTPKYEFAVIQTSYSDQYFRYSVVVCSSAHGKVSQRHKFLTVCAAPPKWMYSYGPWLFIVMPYGVEIYDYILGEHVQSVMEEHVVIHSSLSCRSTHYGREGTSALYNKSNMQMLVTDKYEFYLMQLFALADVVSFLVADADKYGNAAQSLMQFGHSIGCQVLMLENNLSFSFTSSAARELDEYEELLRNFTILDQDGDVDFKLGGKQCSQCKRAFNRVLNKPRNCDSCGMQYCENCVPKTEISHLGYPEINVMRLCSHCSQCCDRNLFTLLENEKHPQTIRYLAAYPERCSVFNLKSAGPMVLHRCLVNGKYELCATLLPEVIGSDVRQWEYWVLRFAMLRATTVLADHVPICADGENTTLDSWVYTTVLSQLIRQNPKELCRILEKWPISIYDPVAIAEAVEGHLRFRQSEAKALQQQCCPRAYDAEFEQVAIGRLYIDEETETFIRCLLLLYGSMGARADVVRVYIEHYVSFLPTPTIVSQTRPRSRCVFKDHRESFDVQIVRVFPPPKELLDVWEYMADHKLYYMLQRPHERPPDCVYAGPSLLMASVTRYCGLLADFLLRFVDGSDSGVMLASIVDQLQSEPLVLIQLLDAMSTRSVSSTARYHSLQADLYIAHMPHRLLPFLRNPQVSNLNLKRLSEYVQNKRMFAELAYLVGKMGSHQEAIRIIVRCLKEPKVAIQYVEDANDPSLWDDVIRHVIQSPIAIGNFLEHMSSHYPVADFLRKIPTPNRLRVPNEGPRLGKLLGDLRLEEKIHSNAVHSTMEDILKMQKRLVRQKSAAICFEPRYETCPLCGLPSTSTSEKKIAILGCGHMYHVNCITQHYALPAFKRRPAKRRNFGDNTQEMKKSSWEYAFQSYLVHRECDVGDIVELLPKSAVLLILSFLPAFDRYSACGLVCHSWRTVVIESLSAANSLDPSPSARYQQMYCSTYSRPSLASLPFRWSDRSFDPIEYRSDPFDKDNPVACIVCTDRYYELENIS